MNNKKDINYINYRLISHYEYIKSLGYNIVAIFAQGSMNYNLFQRDENYMSDVDTKCIVLPTLENLIRGIPMISKKYDFEGEQIDVKDIRLMMDIWKKQNPSYLEILFSNYKIINPLYKKYFDKILDMRDEIVKMNVPQLARCIRGMAAEKVVALDHPYPATMTKINDHGFDEKQLASTARLAYLMQNLFNKDMNFGDAILFFGELRETVMRIKLCKDIFKNEKLTLEDAKIYEDSYDKICSIIKNEVIEKYGKDDFKDNIYRNLQNIVYELVRFGIIHDVKEIFIDNFTNIYNFTKDFSEEDALAEEKIIAKIAIPTESNFYDYYN